MRQYFFPALRRALPAAFVCALLLSLPACGPLLSPGPAPTRLYLAPAMPGKSYAKAVDKQVLVPAPAAPAALETDRVALVFNERELRYLADTRWAGAVPLMVQRALIEALESTGGLKGVGDELAGLAADARLLLDLKDFSLHYPQEGAVPSGTIKAAARLVNLHTGKVLAVKNIAIAMPATGKDNASLARALEKALEKALAELAPWVVETMRKVPR